MVRLFFSYSHKDEALRDELEKHLAILKRQGVISTWHDRRINAGADLDSQINSYLKSADIILLLVSSDFLSSDYCYDNEMQFAIEKHREGSSVVIPVILRPCDWHSAPFGKLMATPTDGKPVTKFASYDEAFLEITTSIKNVIQSKFSSQSDQNVTPLNIQSSTPFRSSNLSVVKTFSDQQRDKFLDDAFEYIQNYFESSLKELKTRHPEIDYNFKRLDSQSFSVTVYLHQSAKSQCMVFHGDSGMMSKGISYSRTISSSRNSLNEAVSVEDDGNMLYLKAIMSGFGMGRSNGKLTFEGAAEHFWTILMEPLQRG